MIAYPRKKHRGLKFLVLPWKKSQNHWDFCELWQKIIIIKKLQYFILMISKCFMHDLFFIFKIYFYCNQLTFQNKMTLNKKVKTSCLSLDFSSPQQKKFIKLGLFLLSVLTEMNLPFPNCKRCLNKIFLPGSCYSRNSEFVGLLMPDDGSTEILGQGGFKM